MLVHRESKEGHWLEASRGQDPQQPSAPGTEEAGGNTDGRGEAERGRGGRREERRQGLDRHSEQQICGTGWRGTAIKASGIVQLRDDSREGSGHREDKTDT